jgi:hypothetical protein
MTIGSSADGGSKVSGRTGKKSPPSIANQKFREGRDRSGDAKDRAYSCNPSQRCVYGGIGSISGDQTSSRGADQFAGL